ncbi:Asp23/Gls24 family envelope stress response protein [Rubrobacter aplysinae]|uniref:Asp23/Gls24 family envelope stress response protein n=1 Tax=Rubrobacter aplysinae TaxID=909625 RepID=UPI00064B96A0|nr:Asp23/Gls24 family envelope stress response protein [Rubrobacter aplysinae]
MSESKGQQNQQSQQRGQQSNSPLQSERGGTTIQSAVVSKVSGIAAQEVDGIRMGGGGSQAAAGLIGSITGNQGGGQTTGVTVEVGQEEAAIDLILTAEYGKSIPQLTEAVRRNVINRVENLVGLKVNEVNIDVTNIFFPQNDQNQQQLEQGQQQQSG